MAHPPGQDFNQSKISFQTNQQKPKLVATDDFNDEPTDLVGGDSKDFLLKPSMAINQSSMVELADIGTKKDVQDEEVFIRDDLPSHLTQIVPSAISNQDNRTDINTTPLKNSNIGDKMGANEGLFDIQQYDPLQNDKYLHIKMVMLPFTLFIFVVLINVFLFSLLYKKGESHSNTDAYLSLLLVPCLILNTFLMIKGGKTLLSQILFPYASSIVKNQYH